MCIGVEEGVVVTWLLVFGWGCKPFCGGVRVRWRVPVDVIYWLGGWAAEFSCWWYVRGGVLVCVGVEGGVVVVWLLDFGLGRDFGGVGVRRRVPVDFVCWLVGWAVEYSCWFVMRRCS